MLFVSSCLHRVHCNISVAVDEDMRKKKASDYHSNFLASNLTTKVYKSNQSFPAQSLELFTLLTSGGRCSDPVVKLNGKDYVGKKSRKVIYFNRVELAKSNFFTCEAICKTNKSKGRELIVPSFNGTWKLSTSFVPPSNYLFCIWL